MTGTKRSTWIKVAPLRPQSKASRLLPAKTTRHRVQKISSEVAPPFAPPMEEKVEVLELAEVAALPVVEEVAVPSVVEEVATSLVVEEVVVPSVVEKVVVPEAQQEIEVVKPIEPVSAPLKQGKKPRLLGFNLFRLGDKVTFLALFTVTIAFLGGVSFAGLLQSTESVGTSGILVRTVDPTPPALSSPIPAPPEPEIEIDVYSDVGCTTRLTEVEWGSIEVGGSVERVIYVRNSGDAEVFLSLLTDNWSPAAASDHMSVSWDYDGSTLRSGEVLEVVLSLDVEASTPVLGEFSFEIIIVGSAL